MRSKAAGFLIAAAFLGRFSAAQEADRLQFLPPGASAATLISDSDGNLYAGGSLNQHGFVTRLPAGGAGAVVLYTIAGSGPDSVASLAVGPGGAIFATGTTTSPDFPATTASISPPSTNNPRAFVLKLDPDGALVYATLIPGPTTYGIAIAVNAKGEALVGGQLVALAPPAFPTTPGAVTGNADPNTGFLVKLDSTGAKILVAIRGYGLGPVAYDSSDDIYVAGAAYGNAGIAPTPGAFQSSHDIRACAGTAFLGIACSYQYVAKINADGTRLFYSTFVTGTYGAVPSGLTVDSAGNALIAGTTNSADYPVTPGAYQTGYLVTDAPSPLPPSPKPPVVPPPPSGYLTRLNSDGTGLVWSTFFSGSGAESITGLGVDPQGNSLISGSSGSRDLPGAQAVPDGCAPGYAPEIPYVAWLSGDGSALIASRYVYGLGASSLVRLALGPDGTPVIGAGDVFKPVDLAASTPLACTTDPADNAHVVHVAPGQLLTVFGEDFGDSAKVSIGGIPAPVLYTSAQQINAQVPVELADRDVVSLTVQIAGGLALSRALRIVPRAPSAFLDLTQVNGPNGVLTCRGVTFAPAYAPVARNDDGSLNNCDTPAASGSIVTFYLNGLGATTPPVSLRYPGSGTVLDVEQDPDSPPGVWRLRVELPPNASSGSLEPLIDGVPLREAFLGIWVRR